MVAHTLSEHLEEGRRQYDALTGQARLFVDLQTAGGKSVWDAYREAGYRGKQPTAASKMATVYRAAIDFRKAQTTQKIEDEREAQLARLKRYARGSIAKVYPKTLRLTDKEWEELPEDVKGLISEITVDTVTEGSGEERVYVRKVKIKLEPRMAAEAMLARLGGWFAAEKADPDLKVILERLAAFAAAKKAKGK